MQNRSTIHGHDLMADRRELHGKRIAFTHVGLPLIRTTLDGVQIGSIFSEKHGIYRNRIIRHKLRRNAGSRGKNEKKSEENSLKFHGLHKIIIQIYDEKGSPYRKTGSC